MSDSSPTKVRFHVLGITTLVAFLMYLDRACIGWIINAESFQSMGLEAAGLCAHVPATATTLACCGARARPQVKVEAQRLAVGVHE